MAFATPTSAQPMADDAVAREYFEAGRVAFDQPNTKARWPISDTRIGRAAEGSFSTTLRWPRIVCNATKRRSRPSSS